MVFMWDKLDDLMVLTLHVRRGYHFNILPSNFYLYLNYCLCCVTRNLKRYLRNFFFIKKQIIIDISFIETCVWKGIFLIFKHKIPTHRCAFSYQIAYLQKTIKEFKCSISIKNISINIWLFSNDRVIVFVNVCLVSS